MRGSGDHFFGGCGLRCALCQNADISWQACGREEDAAALASTMLKLQEHGCDNVNVVTPIHVVPQVIEAVAIAAERGLRLPIVYTRAASTAPRLSPSSTASSTSTCPTSSLALRAAARYASALEYPDVALRALAEIHRQVGVLRFDENGLARRGVLVRHLVMPGPVDESRRSSSGWTASCRPTPTST